MKKFEEFKYYLRYKNFYVLKDFISESISASDLTFYTVSDDFLYIYKHSKYGLLIALPDREFHKVYEL